LEVSGDRGGGEHDGQVRLDRVAGVVEDRSGGEIVYGHPELTARYARNRDRNRRRRWRV